MIGYFLDGNMKRKTMGLPTVPVPYWRTAEFPETRLDPDKFDAPLPTEPSVKIVTYRLFKVIGDRAYYTSETTAGPAWDNLSRLICEDIEQDRRAKKAGLI